MSNNPKHVNSRSLGFAIMLLGVLGYALATYLIFFIEASWLGLPLGILIIIASLISIGYGFSLSGRIGTHDQRSHQSPDIRRTRGSAVVSTAELIRIKKRMSNPSHESNT